MRPGRRARARGRRHRARSSLGAIDLSTLTTLRLGGRARGFVACATRAELVAAIRELDAAGEPLLVLAGGSNVVIADAGFDGTVVHVITRGIEHEQPRGHVRAEAGEPWDPFVERMVSEGLAGVEALSGIPGSVGATPIQNVGAYGQEVAQTITAVEVLDRADGSERTLSAAECGFDYRTSRFKGDPRWVVLGVAFRLDEGGMSPPIRYAELARRLGVSVGACAPIADVREAVLELRRGKGMVVDPLDPDSVSAGSFFTNPVLSHEAWLALRDRAGEDPPAWPEPDGRIKTSAAWLIERAGFSRGHGDGPVGLSTKHTLALVNRGDATTADLVAFARLVAAGVEERFGVALTPEPVFVGHSW